MVIEPPIYKPKISVLMSVFNEQVTFLRQAITSVLEQTFADFELIIMDDGSDNTQTIRMIEDYAASDSRIRLFREPHRGLTETLNVGLSYCKGEFVCRHDSDDWSAPHRLERQFEFLLANPDVGIVGSYAQLVQENGNPLWVIELPTSPDEIMQSFKNINPFCHGSVCFRRKGAMVIGGYREGIKYAQDYDYFWRMCEAYGGFNLPIPLYYLRITRGSISSLKTIEQMEMRLVAQKLAEMRNAGESEDFISALVYAKNITHENNYVDLCELKKGDRYLLAGYKNEAMAIYMKVMLRNPLMWITWFKILRWAAFISIPSTRKKLFDHNM